MSELTRWRNGRRPRGQTQVVALLKTLGVPNVMLYVKRGRGQSFWHRNINHLAVLEMARRLYRLQMGQLHPDRPGGNNGRALELNRIWSRVRKLFKDHGHELDAPSKNGSSLQWHQPQPHRVTHQPRHVPDPQPLHQPRAVKLDGLCAHA